MTNADFVSALGAIFEHSPWVAQRAATARPFSSRLQLTTAMRSVVNAASVHEQLALIQAHPQLGARKFHHAKLTEASANEQRRAGLDALSEVQVAHLLRFNTEYERKFSFPFILAVRGRDPKSILEAIERRLENGLDAERKTALDQIGLIGAYRLADLVTSPSGSEIQAMTAMLAAAPERCAQLLHEWMLGAGLAVERSDTALLGHAASSAAVLVGVYQRPSGAVLVDGALGVLTGIAMAHLISHRMATNTYGVAVLAVLQAMREPNVFPPARLSFGADVDIATLDAVAINLPQTTRLEHRYRLLVAEPGQSPVTSTISLEALERGLLMLEQLLRRQ